MADSTCCKGCPDRWIEGTKRCHETCEKYQAMVAERRALNEKHAREKKGKTEADLYMFENIAKREHRKHRKTRRYW